MLKSYFKLAYRNLLKNRLSSFINIFGLSVAIGCSIIFFLLLDLEYSSDRFHENAENIFMVGYVLDGDDSHRHWGDPPLPLGPELESALPQIIQAVRVVDRRGTFRYGEKVLNESVRFVDPGFLEMFTFPLKAGDALALSNANSVVLSERVAEKYFGDEDPINQQIVLTFNRTYTETFLVKGVAAKFPIDASFSFGILASLDDLQALGLTDLDDWSKSARATFIRVGEPEDISAIAAQMNPYVQRQNLARVDRPIATYTFEHLPTLSWESQDILKSISSGSTPQALILFFVIGLFLLLQACFNYVNIALASGTQRFKEIGIRKVSGGKRLQLITQFLTENLLLCFLSLLAGLLLTELILLPGFFEITGSVDKISLLDFFENPRMWTFFLLLMLMTGLGAAAYPALLISKLQPVSILKGKATVAGKNRFTRFLLSFQFGIAFTIICLVTTFMQNNRYQREQDWGYNQEQVISVRLQESTQFEALRNAAGENPQILQVAGTAHNIGRDEQHAVVEVEAKPHEVVRLDVGFEYLQTLGIRLKQGRFFDSALSTDAGGVVVVNEKFLDEVGWQQAVDKVIRYHDQVYTVIGVVEDFHHSDFFHEIQPVVMRATPAENFRYLVMRVDAGAGVTSADFLRTTWRNLFPDSPYTALFQDSVFDQAFRNNETITRIFGATAAITLIISCMGLFGLVTLIIAKRSKELSIHKVLGASTRQITNLIGKRLGFLLAASIAVAIPGGYLLLNGLLDGIYPYHMPLGTSPFVLAAALVLGTAVLTVMSQIYTASVRNPIDALQGVVSGARGAGSDDPRSPSYRCGDL